MAPIGRRSLQVKRDPEVKKTPTYNTMRMNAQKDGHTIEDMSAKRLGTSLWGDRELNWEHDFATRTTSQRRKG